MRRNGFTLVETLLVTALGVGIAAAVFAKAHSVREDALAANVGSQAEILRDAVLLVYETKADFTGLSGYSFAPMAPAELQKPGASGSAPAGLSGTFGDMDLRAVSPGARGVAPPTFSVVVNNADSKMCARLTSAAAGSFDDILVAGVSVGGRSDHNTNLAVALCDTNKRADIDLVSGAPRHWADCLALGVRFTQGACPIPKTGRLLYKSSYACPSGYEPGAWSAPVLSKDECV